MITINPAANAISKVANHTGCVGRSFFPNFITRAIAQRNAATQATAHQVCLTMNWRSRGDFVFSMLALAPMYAPRMPINGPSTALDNPTAAADLTAAEPLAAPAAN